MIDLDVRMALRDILVGLLRAEKTWYELDAFYTSAACESLACHDTAQYLCGVYDPDFPENEKNTLERESELMLRMLLFLSSECQYVEEWEDHPAGFWYFLVTLLSREDPLTKTIIENDYWPFKFEEEYMCELSAQGNEVVRWKQLLNEALINGVQGS